VTGGCRCLKVDTDPVPVLKHFIGDTHYATQYTETDTIRQLTHIA